MSEHYPCIYNGKNYNKTIKGWHVFLADKPIFKHMTYNAMLNRLNEREKRGLTIAQALGIVEYQSKHSGIKKTNFAVSKADMPKYLMVNKFLSRGLA